MKLSGEETLVPLLIYRWYHDFVMPGNISNKAFFVYFVLETMEKYMTLRCTIPRWSCSLFLVSSVLNNRLIWNYLFDHSLGYNLLVPGGSVMWWRKYYWFVEYRGQRYHLLRSTALQVKPEISLKFSLPFEAWSSFQYVDTNQQNASDLAEG